MTVWEEEIQTIYSFICRTAENPESGVCWETIDYENKPQRHYNLLNGVGGIPLFLHDYFRYSGDGEALGLAEKALDWCLAYVSSIPNNEMNFQRGEAKRQVLPRRLSLNVRRCLLLQLAIR
ncbi:hypothetical protein [Pelagicoccus sp. SDUM812002]|uniref:hypothetical protein n=1 Tax=Pelagicoccus sp. SDUM812002 TaxID=3041266 RepID=UPI00280C87EA|nr:hypothetical protein [Pelagicoccus sp. SDUM812002]MDQ8187101.1 hypothetical protein [Pelagicoccus sp. SDUM812002]